MDQNSDFKTKLAQLQVPPRILYSSQLEQVLAGETSENSDGYPIISENSFYTFLDEVPHLFAHGSILLNIIRNYREIVPNVLGFSHKEKDSLTRSLKVSENIVLTAAITAPSDLWVLKWVLSTHKKLSLTEPFLTKEWVDLNKIISDNKLDKSQYLTDIELFSARGWIEYSAAEHKARLQPSPSIYELYKGIQPTSDKDAIDWVSVIASYLINDDGPSKIEIDNYFGFQARPSSKSDWVPDHFELELGSRLLLLILAIRSLNLTEHLKESTSIIGILPNLTSTLFSILVFGGLVDSKLKVTPLGARIFERGPGPFGIIYAYLSYLVKHEQLLKGKKKKVWVERGKNVAASQDANRKSFIKTITSLTQFQEEHQYPISLFIEHAVGEGEATRLHAERYSGNSIQYIGADLEDAAIDRAVINQENGVLPENMKFVRNADIGEPDHLFKQLEKLEIPYDHGVMVVGNGFHEVRDQTNEKMVNIFKQYCDANLILIFTEESGLSSEDLIETGWNTYHAGFRYVHEISGQGLRPATTKRTSSIEKKSWQKCIALSGYILLPKYTTHSRTIFPHPKPDGHNPSISVNYFCIPAKLAKKLNITS